MEKDWSDPLDCLLIGVKDLIILIRSEDEARQLKSIFDSMGIIRENLDVLDAWYSLDGNMAYRVDSGGYDWGFARPVFYDHRPEYDSYLRFTFAQCVELDDIDIPSSGMGMFE